MGVVLSTASANGTALNVNGNGDARLDLMLTACRQNSTTCNGVAAIATIATINPASAATASIRTIATAFTGTADKCTFVHNSLIGAPTFKIEKSGTNYLLSTYDVHYAEYTNDAWM